MTRGVARLGDSTHGTCKIHKNKSVVLSSLHHQIMTAMVVELLDLVTLF